MNLMSNRRVATLAVISGLSMAGLVWAAQGRSLNVTVTYQGSGEVSASNAIFLSAWDSPDFEAGALPIANQVVQENGATVSLENLSSATVYLTALYDAQGGWTGVTAVPSGTPAGVYSTDEFGAPTAIAVGDGQTVDVEFTFDDTFRMP